MQFKRGERPRTITDRLYGVATRGRAHTGGTAHSMNSVRRTSALHTVINISDLTILLCVMDVFDTNYYRPGNSWRIHEKQIPL